MLLVKIIVVIFMCIAITSLQVKADCEANRKACLNAASQGRSFGCGVAGFLDGIVNLLGGDCSSPPKPYECNDCPKDNSVYFTSLMNKINQLDFSFEDYFKKLPDKKDFNSKLQKLSANDKKTLAKLKDIVTRFRNLQDVMSDNQLELINEMNEQNLNIKTIKENQSKAQKNLKKEFNNLLEKISERQTNENDDLKKELQVMRNQLDNFNSQLSKAQVESLKKLTKRLSTAEKKLQQEINSATAVVKKHLEGVTQQLTLNEENEVERFKKITNQITEDQIELMESIKGVMDQAKNNFRAIKSFHNEATDYLDLLNRNDQDLVRKAENIINAMENNYNQLDENDKKILSEQGKLLVKMDFIMTDVNKWKKELSKSDREIMLAQSKLLVNVQLSNERLEEAQISLDTIGNKIELNTALTVYAKFLSRLEYMNREYQKLPRQGNLVLDSPAKSRFVKKATSVDSGMHESISFVYKLFSDQDIHVKNFFTIDGTCENIFKYNALIKSSQDIYNMVQRWQDRELNLRDQKQWFDDRAKFFDNYVSNCGCEKMGKEKTRQPHGKLSILLKSLPKTKHDKLEDMKNIAELNETVVTRKKLVKLYELQQFDSTSSKVVDLIKKYWIEDIERLVELYKDPVKKNWEIAYDGKQTCVDLERNGIKEKKVKNPDQKPSAISNCKCRKVRVKLNNEVKEIHQGYEGVYEQAPDSTWVSSDNSKAIWYFKDWNLLMMGSQSDAGTEARDFNARHQYLKCPDYIVSKGWQYYDTNTDEDVNAKDNEINMICEELL